MALHVTYACPVHHRGQASKSGQIASHVPFFISTLQSPHLELCTPLTCPINLQIDLDYFELENFGFLNPTVAGIATV
jgi:hypothetical protein